jgi:hypothetical protein
MLQSCIVGYVTELHCGLCYRAALWVMLQSCIVGYVTELHFHAKKALVWNRTTVQF